MMSRVEIEQKMVEAYSKTLNPQGTGAESQPCSYRTAKSLADRDHQLRYHAARFLVYIADDMQLQEQTYMSWVVGRA